jgi:glycosyltransferase involved in cell wall biosynthesis
MTADAVGGVWGFALDLAAGLAARGTRTDLAVLGPAPSAGQRAAAAAVPGLTVRHVPVRLEWMPGAEADRAEAARLLTALAEDVRPDLVHANGYAEAALPWGAPVVLTCHSDVATWWLAVHGTEPPPEWRAYRERVRAALRASDVAVAPTAAHADAVAAAYPGAPRPRAVPNGRDPGRRPAAGAREPVALAAGRLWDGAKGMDALDRAAGRIGWPVEAAGPADGPGGAAAFRHVRALGPLTPDELADRMSRAAVFVHPARYEPFGLAPLEAALAGCALVLGDVPSLRELWDGAALFVPPGDAGRLAVALDRVLGDPRLAARLGAAARSRAARYPARRMLAGYLRAYAEARARPRGRSGRQAA